MLSWSGGKDSALALEALLDSGEYEIAALLSGLIESEGRLIMHEVRQELIARQADALGLPLAPFYLPRGAPNAVYENRLLARLAPFREQGVIAIAFGDLFLKDIRAYREKLFAGTGFEPLFPIWQRDTRGLARRFADEDYRAITVCVDARALDASYAGVMMDKGFLERLPGEVDPCGENGEFHTFVFDGPAFRAPVRVKPDAVARRGDFYYCDLLPEPSARPSASAVASRP